MVERDVTLRIGLKGLGHGEAVHIDEAEFDNLFVLVPREGKSPVVLKLKY